MYMRINHIMTFTNERSSHEIIEFILKKKKKQKPFTRDKNNSSWVRN